MQWSPRLCSLVCLAVVCTISLKLAIVHSLFHSLGAAPASSSRCSSGTSEYHSSASRQQSDRDASAAASHNPETGDTVDDQDATDGNVSPQLVVEEQPDSPSLAHRIADLDDDAEITVRRALLHPADVTSPARATNSPHTPRSHTIGGGALDPTPTTTSAERDHTTRHRLSRTLDLSFTQLATSGGGHTSGKKLMTSSTGASRRATSSAAADSGSREKNKSFVVAEVESVIFALFSSTSKR
jgi:hypothetical protein